MSTSKMNLKKVQTKATIIVKEIKSFHCRMSKKKNLPTRYEMYKTTKDQEMVKNSQTF